MSLTEPNLKNHKSNSMVGFVILSKLRSTFDILLLIDVMLIVGISISLAALVKFLVYFENSFKAEFDRDSKLCIMMA